MTTRIFLCCAALGLTASAAAATTSDLADAVMRRDATAVRAAMQKKSDVNAPQNDERRGD